MTPLHYFLLATLITLSIDRVARITQGKHEPLHDVIGGVFNIAIIIIYFII